MEQKSSDILYKVKEDYYYDLEKDELLSFKSGKLTALKERDHLIVKTKKKRWFNGWTISVDGQKMTISKDILMKNLEEKRLKEVSRDFLISFINNEELKSLSSDSLKKRSVRRKIR